MTTAFHERLHWKQQAFSHSISADKLEKLVDGFIKSQQCIDKLVIISSVINILPSNTYMQQQLCMTLNLGLKPDMLQGALH